MDEADKPTSDLTPRIRQSGPDDVAAIRRLTVAAFAAAAHSAPPVDDTGDPGEAALVVWLLEDALAIPELSLVAVGDAGHLVGHVICSRGRVDGHPALGLGPLSVHPDHQRGGVGSALVHAVLGAAEALDEPLVALLGDPGYYGRFGFHPASQVGIIAPEPSWGGYFQVRTLAAYDADVTGAFRYSEPFDRL